MKKFSVLILLSLAISGCSKKEIVSTNTTPIKQPQVAADGCTFGYDQSNTKVEWTAFKLASKAPVKGQFTKFSVLGEAREATIEKILEKVAFNIDASSVDTKNAPRDMKIAKFFFSTMKGGANIQGKFENINEKSKTLDLVLNFNGFRNSVPMTYTIDGNNLVVSGDFSAENFSKFNMQKQVKALHKACEAKHGPKIWAEYELKLTSSFLKICN